MTRTAGSAARTGAAMRRPERLPRFTPAERFAHRSVAGLGIILTVSGLILYLPELSLLVARRTLVEGVHVVAGLLLPLPVFAAWLSPAFRADLAVLNRFYPSDWAWLRNRDRRTAGYPVGKFNAGQKINSWLSAGSILVLVGSGVLMFFTRLAPLAWRTGATFVHDWFALGLFLLVAGHLYRALRDPEARRGMRHGTVSESWARTEHRAWAEELSEK